jgi:hypothetical protein
MAFRNFGKTRNIKSCKFQTNILECFYTDLSLRAYKQHLNSRVDNAHTSTSVHLKNAHQHERDNLFCIHLLFFFVSGVHHADQQLDKNKAPYDRRLIKPLVVFCAGDATPPSSSKNISPNRPPDGRRISLEIGASY